MPPLSLSSLSLSLSLSLSHTHTHTHTATATADNPLEAGEEAPPLPPHPSYHGMLQDDGDGYMEEIYDQYDEERVEEGEGGQQQELDEDSFDSSFASE